MKKFIVVLLLAVSAFSCIPDDGVNPIEATVNNPLEINAPNGFTWSTTSTINVRLDKLFIPVTLTRVVELRDDNGNVFFKGSHDLAKDLSLSLTLPNHVQSLTLQVGEVVMKETITNGQLNFSFPVIDSPTAD